MHFPNSILQNFKKRIGGVIVSVLASSGLDPDRV
jgi:hypothetical protein